MGDAIDDDVIAGRLRHFDAADMNVFRYDARNIFVVDSINEGGGETVLHPVNNAYFTHPSPQKNFTAMRRQSGQSCFSPPVQISSQ